MGSTDLKRSERPDARVTPEEKQVIETAASLRGISVTDFLRIRVKEAAHRTIQESESLVLGEKFRRLFIEMLLNPPKPNAKALAAARRMKAELG